MQGATVRVRTILRRPLSDRWNVDAVKAIEASPRVPNPKDLNQDRVLPERLTKVIEVEETGMDIPQAADKIPEFKFREFKITKAILERFGYTPGCKGCAAAMAGTDARRHADECRSRIEEAIKTDDILRMRLDMRDSRLGRNAPPSEQAKQEEPKVEVDIDAAMGDEDTAGDAVAEGLIRAGEKEIVTGPPEEDGVSGKEQQGQTEGQ